jgi:hypothetical protein
MCGELLNMLNSLLPPAVAQLLCGDLYHQLKQLVHWAVCEGLTDFLKCGLLSHLAFTNIGTVHGSCGTGCFSCCLCALPLQV